MKIIMNLYPVGLLTLALCAYAEAKPPVYIYSGATECLLGAHHNHRWVEAAKVNKFPSFPRKYFTTSLNGKPQILITDSRPVHESTPCPETYRIQFNPVDEVLDEEFIAVSHNQAKPARFRQLNDTQIYHKSIAKLLVSKGIARPKIRIQQIIQLDVQSDGVDEVLISASYLAAQTSGELLVDVPSWVKSNDYSILVLRQVVNGKVEMKIIEEDIHLNVTYDEFSPPPSPAQYKIIGILDVNGDGRLELVTRSLVQQGMYVDMYEYSNGTYTRRLFCGCGL